MRRVPIRTKLAVALSVPLLALAVTTALEVVNLDDQVEEIKNQTALARVAVGPSGLITHLQDERSYAAVKSVGSDQLGVVVPVKGYNRTRALTDRAVESVRAAIQAKGPAVSAVYQSALDGLDALDQLRADIDGNRRTEPTYGTNDNGAMQDDLYVRYTQILRPFFDATDKVILTIDDDRLRRGAELVIDTSRLIELFRDSGKTMAVLLPRAENHITSPDDIREIVSRKLMWDQLVFDLKNAQAPYDTVVDKLFPVDFVDDFTTLFERVGSGEEVSAGEPITALGTANHGGLREFRIGVSDKTTEVADAVRADAEQRERLFVFLAVAALVAALGLTWLVSRSITRPLRSLTAQAKSMAEDLLPAAVHNVLQTPLGENVTVPQLAPVSVKTRDEVLDVSAALNTVQATAIDLAVEQAVLRRNIADSFVNLGRRNQNLLMRQLDLITRLENAEVDADALANLFRLDHLATRMRRNAESLLVLAGVEPPRQWARPVSVMDVVRAALSEVEDYQRVAVRDLQTSTVVGAAAADLAHLLAELIENGLAFSPAHTPVEVRGRFQITGHYVLAIIDKGIGMPPDAVDVSNRRLAGLESFTVAPSKYLGHYVAGNLAARHRIGVQVIQSSRANGTTVTVDLPPPLLAPTAPPLADASPRGGIGPVSYAPVGTSGGGRDRRPRGRRNGNGGDPPIPDRVPSRPSWWGATAEPTEYTPDKGAYGPRP